MCQRLRDCASAMADQAATENISYLEFTVRLFGEEITAKAQRMQDKKIKEAQLLTCH